MMEGYNDLICSRASALAEAIVGADNRTVKAKKGEDRKYLLPTGAHLLVQNGAEVNPGDILAKIPRATSTSRPPEVLPA